MAFGSGGGGVGGICSRDRSRQFSLSKRGRKRRRLTPSIVYSLSPASYQCLKNCRLARPPLPPASPHPSHGMWLGSRRQPQPSSPPKLKWYICICSGSIESAAATLLIEARGGRHRSCRISVKIFSSSPLWRRIRTPGSEVGLARVSALNQ